MTKRTKEAQAKTIEFSPQGKRIVEGKFDGGSMTGDAGVMLLSEVDRKLGLSQTAARHLADPRDPGRITHTARDMLRQRIYGLALGWEDLNDHSTLREDIAMQTAVGVEREVASAPTLCRLENWSDRQSAWGLHEVLVEQFIASFKSAPEELILDFDATDNRCSAGLCFAPNPTSNFERLLPRKLAGSLRLLPVVAAPDLAPPDRALTETKRRSTFR